MTTIKPKSVQDLADFVDKHMSDIKEGIYDLNIELAWVPDLTEEMACFLARYSCSEGKRILALSHSTSAKALALLAKEREHINLIARNRNSDPDTLLMLSKLAEPEEWDRERCEALGIHICENPNVPAEALAILSKNSIDSIRCAVAKHPKTPSTVLDILARDNIYDVRISVAKNKNAQPATLSILKDDIDQEKKHRDRIKRQRLWDFIKEVLIPSLMIGSIVALVSSFMSDNWIAWGVTIGVVWGLILKIGEA